MLVIFPEDMAAFRKEIERHVKRFGDDPAPHLEAAAKKDMERIVDCLRQCIVPVRIGE